MNKIIKYIGASAVVCMMAGCTTNFEDFNTNLSAFKSTGK